MRAGSERREEQKRAIASCESVLPLFRASLCWIERRISNRQGCNRLSRVISSGEAVPLLFSEKERKTEMSKPSRKSGKHVWIYGFIGGVCYSVPLLLTTALMPGGGVTRVILDQIGLFALVMACWLASKQTGLMRTALLAALVAGFTTALFLLAESLWRRSWELPGLDSLVSLLIVLPLVLIGLVWLLPPFYGLHFSRGGSHQRDTTTEVVAPQTTTGNEE
jgi:hypothetical protein